jgi:hypothetical protein
MAKTTKKGFAFNHGVPTKGPIKPTGPGGVPRNVPTKKR